LVATLTGTSVAQEPTVVVAVPVTARSAAELTAWAQKAGVARIWELSARAPTVGGIADRTLGARAPAQKATVLSGFQDFNQIESFTELPPGKYAAPFSFGSKAPHLAAQAAARRPAQAGFHALTSLPEDAKQGRLNLIVLTDDKPIADTSKPALQLLELPADVARDLRASFPALSMPAASWPISTELAQMPAHNPEPVLGSEILAAAFKNNRVLDPVLVVFDDSWPDDESFEQSRAFFCDGLDQLWAQWKHTFPRNVEARPCPQGLKDRRSTAPPKKFKCADPKDCRTHSQKIKQSLAQFEGAVAAQKPVKTIYLPFNQAQPGARELLDSLFRFHAAKVPSAMGIDLEAKDVMEAFDFAANKIFAKLPEELLPDSKMAPTDLALLNALMTFNREYSKLAGRPIFLNLSWVFYDVDAPLQLPENGFTVAFAAAGNRCDPAGEKPCTEDYLKRRDIFQFVFSTGGWKNYVAVMNVDAKGAPRCKSTRLLSSNVALAYDGSIDGDCGTSFSSPRVAWLVAARTALGFPPQLLRDAKMDGFTLRQDANVADAASWSIAMRQWIEQMRACPHDLKGDYSCMRLSLERLFSDVQKGGTK